MYGFDLSEKIKNELGVQMSINAFCLFIRMNEAIEVCNNKSTKYNSGIYFDDLLVEDNFLYLKIPLCYLETSPFAEHGLDVKSALVELKKKGLIYIESDYIILRYMDMKSIV